LGYDWLLPLITCMDMQVRNKELDIFPYRDG